MTRRELLGLFFAAPLARFVPWRKPAPPAVGGIESATFKFWRNQPPLIASPYVPDNTIYFLNSGGAFKAYANLYVDNPRPLGVITGITE